MRREPSAETGDAVGRPRADNTRTFEGLRGAPREALDFLHAEFAQKRLGAGRTWAEVLAALATQYGIQWHDSGLSRYYAYWASTLRIEDQAREEAEAIVGRLLQDGDKSPDLVAAAKQLLQQQRLLALTKIGAEDPAEVVRLGIAHDRNEIRAAQVALDRKRVELLERKLAAMETRLRAADKQVEDLAAAGALPADVASRIRAMYGLAPEAQG
jgi:hypothetical protein